MKQRKRLFLLFAVCVAAVFGPMTWLTTQLLEFEHKEAAARRAEYAGSLRRSALWRIDAMLATFLTQEAARPYDHYYSFYEPPQAYTETLMEVCDVRMVSPLLAARPPFCRLHFQFKQGVLSSPQAPTDSIQRGEAQRRFGTVDAFNETTSTLNLLNLVVPSNQLPGLAERAAVEREKLAPFRTVTRGGMDHPAAAWNHRVAEKWQSQSEYYVRQQITNRASQSAQTAMMGPTANIVDPDIELGILAPVWIPLEGQDPELLLLRSVQVGSEEIVQGVWVDWPKLRDSLLEEVHDLVPGAQLVRDTSEKPNPDRSVAGIRAVLKTSDLAAAEAGPLTLTKKSLIIAWVAVLLALMAIGFVLHATMELGERRGRFVSAVTHELRTPLTTFCLYSQMLADGMVRDEGAKKEYLITLKREAQRLAKIVENVLCYARLSEVRASAHVEEVDAGDLMERIVPTLARRAAESGLRLEVDTDGARGAMLSVDPQTVERILMNLVENACKYAVGYSPPGGVPDPRVHLRAVIERSGVRITVSDHGPGIPAAQRARIFKAFNRTGREANNAAPGLGLGLSLSRGLARALGGDLVLAPDSKQSRGGSGGGAELSLVIPADVPADSPDVRREHAVAR